MSNEESQPSTATVLRESPSRLEAHLSMKNEPPPLLTIREMSRHGDFVRTIICKPNTITVLVSSEVEDLEHLRSALAGRSSSSIVSLRTGGREMHPSEVYSFSSQTTLFERTTVREALLAVGAPEWAADSLLVEAGLQSQLSQNVRSLDECAVRRLALLCSLFNRAQVVFWESPFAPLTSAWVERMAAMLTKHAPRSGKIFIATGIVRLPNSWNGSKLVTVEALQPWKRRRKSFATTAEPVVKDTVAQMRELMAAVRVVEDATNSIITRPMMIKRGAVRTTAQPELSSSEMISNPQTEEFLAQERPQPFQGVLAQLHDENQIPPVLSSPTNVRAATSRTVRSLLRPSLFEKLSRRSVVYRWSRRLAWRVGSRISVARYCNVTPSGKVSKLSERERFMTHLIQPLLFVLALLFVIRIFG